MTFLWLLLLVLCIIIEAATMVLATSWFALGALGALILSLFPVIPEGVQIIAFVAVSALSLWLLRPLARRHLAVKKEATNADRVIQQIGVVLEDIDNLRNTGAVKAGGKIWTARAYTGEPIPKDAHVRVLFIEGVKLIVEPVAAAQTPHEPLTAEKLSQAEKV